jgi:hypothetical protein
MEKQQTAVECLFLKMSFQDVCKYSNELAEAKQKEEDQIMNAWVSGVVSEADMTAEQYYNETYKK